MKKKGLSIILAAVMTVGAVPFAAAEDASATETAQITQITYVQDFESYTPESSQNTVAEIGDAQDKALLIHRTDTSVDNIEKLTLDTAITQDIVELEFKLLPRETAGEKAEGYIQLFQGSSTARLNVKISCDNGDLDKYRIKVGSKEVISKDDLYHLPKNAEDDGRNFTEENFNKIKMVMHRVDVNGTTDNDLSKFYVYLNGELKGTYTYAELGTGGIAYTAGKSVETVRMYQYRYDTGEPLDEIIYFDDIVVRGKSVVEYIPSELEMNFEASMDYSGDVSKLIVNGTDTAYLEQAYSLSLVNADTASTAQTAQTDAVKSDNSAASFAFSEEVNAEPGWYYVDIQRYIGGEIKGTGKKQKIYVATTQQLADLPGDFSDLPQDDAEACNLVSYYLPCFLTEDEINELFPEENGELTQAATENLSFITAYFKNSSVDYTAIAQVQEDFKKSKGYLELKNAQTQSEVYSVLEKGGYLAEYADDEIFTENTEEFFTHFETKRSDSENLLISDEKIYEALCYSMAMTSLNSAERSEIEEIIKKYNDDVFGLELTAVTADNADTLYSALYNKSYTTTGAVKADWENAVASLPENPETPPELEEDDYSSGSSSSGGSSGGGGGGGYTSKKSGNELLAPEIEPTDITAEPETAQQLTDINGHWAEEAISALYDKEIVTGFEDDTFRPEKTLTRAELVVMLGRILPDIDAESTVKFSDVTEDDWFCAEVEKAAAYGIIQGTDGKFMPYDYITREQLAVIIYRALKAETANEEITFADSGEISDYAAEAINCLSAKKILSGYEDNTIRPKNHTSRAEAAKLLYGLINELEG